MYEEPAEEKTEAKEGKEGKEGEEKKAEPPSVWEKKEWTILEKQAADPLPYLVPEKKKKPAPAPIVGTSDKLYD